MSVTSILTEMGMRFWPVTYGAGLRSAEGILDRIESDPDRRHDVRTTSSGMVGIGADYSTVAHATGAGLDSVKAWSQTSSGPRAVWALQAAAWAEAGYPQITTTHRYAAALACTPTDSPDLVGAVRLPWPSVVLSLPNGLLTLDDGREYSTVIITTLDKVPSKLVGPVATMQVVVNISGEHLSQIAFADSLETYLIEPALQVRETIDGRAVNQSGRKQRVATLAKRIVVGLLLRLADPDLRREVEGLGQRLAGSVKRTPGPPKHRVLCVSRPVSVDCRPAIQRFLGGEGPTPSVQTLVRGHWKRQPCGPARSERRIVHIEPYWRGPEAGAIVSRPCSYDLEASS